jgi:hypothetical protein
MSIKYIHIDYRKPHTKEEKTVYAISHVEPATASVFINVNMHRKSKNLSDTFFHEMAHVFFAFHGKDKQMSDAKEEKLAKEVGRICAEALR